MGFVAVSGCLVGFISRANMLMRVRFETRVRGPTAFQSECRMRVPARERKRKEDHQTSQE